MIKENKSHEEILKEREEMSKVEFNAAVAIGDKIQSRLKDLNYEENFENNEENPNDGYWERKNNRWKNNGW